MKLLALLLLAFCLALPATAATPPDIDAPAVAAYDQLHQTEVFALGGVGYSGATSPGEIAFRELQKEPDAAAFFVALLDDETAAKAGQLYALLGLKEARSAEFEARLPAFLEDDSPIFWRSGCMKMSVSVKTIAARFVDKK